MSESDLLQHGGRLNQVAKNSSIPLEQWIDLSTGINPDPWPVPEIPTKYFSRLPEENDGLLEVAQRYYKCQFLLPVSGSQSVIQLLPAMRAKSKVGVPVIGYAEHAYYWKLHGHELIYYDDNNIEEVLEIVDVLVVINPNNPTGVTYERSVLIKWHEYLQSKSGWLVVDEAFIDCHPENSLCEFADKEGLIVLRSIGKFFGLAGIRAGFVFTTERFLKEISTLLGPWHLSNVARFILKQMLADSIWQEGMIKQLQLGSLEMRNIIVNSSGIEPTGTCLFKTIYIKNSLEVYNKFLKQGILCRRLDNGNGLRFGLAKVENINYLKKSFKLVFG